MCIGDAGQLALGQLQEAVHAIVDVGAVRGGRRFLAGEQLGDVRLGDARDARQIPLIQPQRVQAPPDDQGHIHG